MREIDLGNNGPQLSEIGLGVMPMSSGFYNRQNADEDGAISTIHAALDNGLNFFDTADIYGAGHNEILLGRALKDRRNEAVIATKFGFKYTKEKFGIGIDGRPEYVRQSCESSLRRLSIDAIDLYYQHRVDTAVPIEDTVGAMSELVEKGMVKHIGLSEASAETLKRASAVHPIAALQTEYSLWSRDVEAEILPVCEELRATFVAYSPLGRGFLTENASSLKSLGERDYRLSQPRFQKENFDRNLELVQKIEEMAKEKACTVAQLALAWLLSNRGNIVPIPGTRSEKHLIDNIQAAEIVLNETERKQLDGLSRSVAGNRYGDLGMGWTNM